MDTVRLKQFVETFWDASILPSITDYIRIPNKSPAFDAKWVEHGYMEQAVRLMEAWARPQVEALPGELGRNRARDGRGAPEDEDRRHQPPLTRPSRRASDDESTPRGSRRALIARNSSRRGYMARTASGVVVASLAR